MLKELAFAAALCLTAAPAFGLQPESRIIQSPSSGWVYNGLNDTEEVTAAAYPFNLINRGAQHGRTLIHGRLREAMRALPGDQGKGLGRRPPTLVVNGNPMLLYSDAQGAFARPYAFGPGSNSVELLDADGHSVQRLQFYEANGSRPRARMRVILTWDDPQAEVDLHVLTPDGQHAFWAQPRLHGGGGMDVDSVDGAGPEIFSIMAAWRGPYQFYVNYWGNFTASGYHFDEQTRQKPLITCRITVILHKNTPDERRESFVVPLRRIGELTHIRTLTF